MLQTFYRKTTDFCLAPIHILYFTQFCVLKTLNFCQWSTVDWHIICSIQSFSIHNINIIIGIHITVTLLKPWPKMNKSTKVLIPRIYFFITHFFQILLYKGLWKLIFFNYFCNLEKICYHCKNKITTNVVLASFSWTVLELAIHN